MAGDYVAVQPLAFDFTESGWSPLQPLVFDLAVAPGSGGGEVVPVPFGVGLASRVPVRWSSGRALAVAAAAGWSDLPAVAGDPAPVQWSAGAVVSSVVAAQWSPVDALAVAASAGWLAGVARDQAVRSVWSDVVARSALSRQRWQVVHVQAASVPVRWRMDADLAAVAAVRWMPASAVALQSRSVWQPVAEHDRPVLVPWGAREYGATCTNDWLAVQPLALNFSAAGSGSLSFNFSNVGNPVRCVYPEPAGARDNYRFVQVVLPAGLLIIPTLRTYIMIHDIQLHRLDDTQPIAASQLRISLDADGWAWGWSATLLGRGALDAIRPDSSGVPVVLVATVNGYSWQLIVEDWSENRQGVGRSVSVSGRGLTAELGQPWQLSSSGVTSSDLTLQQVLAGHLPVDSGFSLAWSVGTPDWLVPAGAWSWSDKTPIAAIAEAAAGVGLVLVPGMADRVLTVQPRYPVLPWEYTTTAPDLVIPDAVITSLTSRQPVAAQANGVYVQGGSTGGIIGRIVRDGTAGDRLASSQNHNLITDTAAARLLGSRILAGQQRQPEVRSATIPLSSAGPLVGIGNLLRFEIDGAAHHGICNSVDIAVSLSKTGVDVSQTVTIGEDTTNRFAQFRRLLPSSPLLIGVVSAAYGDGTTTVTMTGGGSVRVRGAGYPSGAAVYVRAGVIEGEAPALSVSEVIV